MKPMEVLIIGGGLSGLYAATLLAQQGIHDPMVLEARGRFGGRILSAPSGHDLGATWLWPDWQPRLSELVRDWGLATIEQADEGDMLFEHARQQPPSRLGGQLSAPAAQRLVGGMATLIDAARQRLNAEALRADHRVQCLRHQGDHIEVEAEDAQGRRCVFQARHVLLALPPRLAAEAIEFTPALPAELMRAWAATPTWMAPHAKYVAVFERPFWREQGLSGQARSQVGPMAEIHDASGATVGATGGALFGFLGVPARWRSEVSEATLLAHCRAQLVRLFGPEADCPRAEHLQDWARDPCTAVEADQVASPHHAASPPSMPAQGPWRGQLIGIASEWSPDFPGYLAGAIDAAQRGVQALAASRVELARSR